MKNLLWVFRKEMREILRERRVVFGSFILPILIINLTLFGMSRLEDSFGKKSSIRLTVVGGEAEPFIQQILKADRMEVTRETDIEKAKAALKKGSTNLVLESPKADGSGQIQITAYSDPTRPMSMAATGAIRAAVQAANAEARKSLLEEAGIDLKRSEPVKLKMVELGGGQAGIGAGALSSLIPYLVILWAFFGAMSMVSDLVAGEKERGTLETLLVSPIKRDEAAGGKLLALTFISSISGLMSLVGVAINVMLSPGKAAGFTLGWEGALCFMLLVLPLSAMYASMLMAISAVAKSVRESQSYLSVASVLVTMPAIMSQFVVLTGDDQKSWTHWMPVLNTSISLGQALKNNPDWGQAGISMGISLVIAAICSGIVIWLFRREAILNRT